jgi:hypothetical protein
MVALGVGALLVLALIFIAIAPRVGNALAGANGIHEIRTLPDHINVCGRRWSKGSFNRELSLSEIRARGGVEPLVVDPGPFAPCPVGPCTAKASRPCHTVVYVRVGADAYIDYSLVGGP